MFSVDWKVLILQFLYKLKINEIIFKVKKPKIKLQGKRTRDLSVAILLWFPTATFSPMFGSDQALNYFFLTQCWR